MRAAIVLVALLMLAPLATALEDASAPASDPGTWTSDDWAHQSISSLSPDQINTYLNNGELPASRYGEVDWSKVTDFSNVALADIPADKWASVDQSRIVGDKVASIPAEVFNPQQVSKENLGFATVDQIFATLNGPNAFPNLRDANPQNVQEAFARDPHSIDLDLSDPLLTNLKFVDGKLVCDAPCTFGAFPIKDFTKDKCTLTLTESGVHIAWKDGKVSDVQGASYFEMQEGTLNLQPALNQPLTYTGDDPAALLSPAGTVYLMQAGTVTAVDGGVVLQKGGTLTDAVSGLEIQAPEGDVAISAGKRLSGVKSVAEVFIEKGTITMLGPAMLKIQGVTLTGAPSSDVLLNPAEGTYHARGNVVVDTKEYALTGTSNAVTFDGKLDGTGDPRIDSTVDGLVARIAKKTELADLGLAQGFNAGERSISMGIIVKTAADTGLKDWSVMVDKTSVLNSLALNPFQFLMMDKTVFNLGTPQDSTASIVFDPNQGVIIKGPMQPTIILPPGAVTEMVGEKDVGTAMAMLLARSMTSQTAQGLRPGDVVTVGGKQGVITAVAPGFVGVDTNGDGKYDLRVDDPNAISGMDPAVLAQRRQQLTGKVDETAGLLELTADEFKGETRGGEAALMAMQLRLAAGETGASQGVSTVTTLDGKKVYFDTSLSDGQEHITRWSLDGTTWNSITAGDSLTAEQRAALGTQQASLLDKVLTDPRGESLRGIMTTNPDFKKAAYVDAKLGDRQYDSWYQGFKADYEDQPTLIQQAATSMARSLLSAGKVDGAFDYLREARDADPSSVDGKQADDILRMGNARMAILSEMMMMQASTKQELAYVDRPRTIFIDPTEFYNNLGQASFIQRALQGIPSINPVSIFKDATRPFDVAEIRNNAAQAQEGLAYLDKMVSAGVKLQDAVDFSSLYYTPSVAGTPGFSTSYYPNGNPGNAEQKDAAQLQPGEDTGWLAITTSIIPNQRTKDELQIGDSPLRYYRLSKGDDGKVYIELSPSAIPQIGTTSKPYELDSFNNYGRQQAQELYPDATAAALKNVGSLSTGAVAYITDPSKSPSVHAAMQLEDADAFTTAARQQNLLDVAKQYREKGYYEAATMIADQLRRQQGPVQEQAQALYADIVNPAGDWTHISDATKSAVLSMDTLRELVNPFSLAVGAGLTKLAAPLSSVPVAGQVLRGYMALTEAPANLLGLAAQSTSRTLVTAASDLTLQLATPLGVGTVSPDAAGVIGMAMGITGGAKVTTINKAMQSAEVAVSDAQVVTSNRVARVLTYTGTVDENALREAGAEVMSKGTYRIPGDTQDIVLVSSTLDRETAVGVRTLVPDVDNAAASLAVRADTAMHAAEQDVAAATRTIAGEEVPVVVAGAQTAIEAPVAASAATPQQSLLQKLADAGADDLMALRGSPEFTAVVDTSTLGKTLTSLPREGIFADSTQRMRAALEVAVMVTEVPEEQRAAVLANFKSTAASVDEDFSTQTAFRASVAQTKIEAGLGGQALTEQELTAMEAANMRKSDLQFKAAVVTMGQAGTSGELRTVWSNAVGDTQVLAAKEILDQGLPDGARVHATSVDRLDSITRDGLQGSQGNYGWGVYFMENSEEKPLTQGNYLKRGATDGDLPSNTVLIRINEERVPASVQSETDFLGLGHYKGDIPAQALDYWDPIDSSWKPVTQYAGDLRAYTPTDAITKGMPVVEQMYVAGRTEAEVTQRLVDMGANPTQIALRAKDLQTTMSIGPAFAKAMAQAEAYGTIVSKAKVPAPVLVNK